jgi:hypothetical protein
VIEDLAVDDLELDAGDPDVLSSVPPHASCRLEAFNACEDVNTLLSCVTNRKDTTQVDVDSMSGLQNIKYPYTRRYALINCKVIFRYI